MRIKYRAAKGFAVLEILLVIAILALIFQLFPSLLALLDARTWTRQAWFFLNVVGVLGLIAMRYENEIASSIRDMRQRFATKHGHAARTEKALDLEEERKLYERMNEARKRQVI